MKTFFGKGRAAAALVGLAAYGLLAAAASGHHSFAMYDLSANKTLTGKLTRFVIGANHSQLIFDLVGEDGNPELDSDGKPVIWGVETGPARQLAEQGVTVKTFKYGTILTVTLHPLRDGRNFGALRNQDGVLIGCGMKMPAGGCNEKTGTVYIGGKAR